MIEDYLELAERLVAAAEARPVEVEIPFDRLETEPQLVGRMGTAARIQSQAERDLWNWGQAHPEAWQAMKAEAACHGSVLTADQFLIDACHRWRIAQYMKFSRARRGLRRPVYRPISGKSGPLIPLLP